MIAEDGESALELFENHTFQLILLDIMLPGQDGFAVCKKIREVSDIPIFIITARVLEEDELHGYALGADDYIAKPFSLPVRFWGYDFEGNERVVDTHIKKLRKVLEGSGCKITTVHKSGYRMEASSL